ncbi:MAG: methyltransferase domain-containing protein [Myxococcales bacterium]|nr:methyltransferase domain-containing protein [Myxococcales bacterium]
MLTMRFEKLGLKPGDKVLDVGCGGGRHIRQTRLLPGIDAIGLDLGQDEVQETARTLRELDQLPVAMGGSVPGAGQWMSMRGSVYQLPFADETFDCVIISEVLEHLHEDERALSELTRVLKRGGTLAASVPREGPEALCWALSKRYRNTPGGHVRIYNRKKLRKMLAEGGFDIVDSHFAHGLHSPYWWLKCAMGVDDDDISLVKLYHRLLVWDMMRRPLLTRVLEHMLVPFIGKSVVFYGIKV